MTLALPALLGDLIAAHNTQNVDTFVAAFAAEAVVRDEGRIHYGQPAIRAWFEEVSQKYRATIDVTDLLYIDGEPVIVGEVSGDFPGSPITLRYYLGIEDEKIVSLQIKG